MKLYISNKRLKRLIVKGLDIEIEAGVPQEKIKQVATNITKKRYYLVWENGYGQHYTNFWYSKKERKENESVVHTIIHKFSKEES